MDKYVASQMNRYLSWQPFVITYTYINYRKSKTFRWLQNITNTYSIKKYISSYTN